jgi:hypothetical protein
VTPLNLAVIEPNSPVATTDVAGYEFTQPAMRNSTLTKILTKLISLYRPGENSSARNSQYSGSALK